MTSLQHAVTPSLPDPATGRRTTIRLLVGLGAVAVLAITIGIVLARGSSPAGAQQLKSTEQACHQWAGGYAPSEGSAPTVAWCTAMTDWMGQQLHGGHMTGQMMWSNTSSMAATCSQWISTGPQAALGVGPQACDAMVAWMAHHTSDWASWMATGRMMGQGP